MFRLIVLCLIVGYSYCQLSVKVVESDMNQTVIDYAVGEALILFNDQTNTTVVAKKLVDLMNNKYGNGWITITGTNTMISGIQTVKNSTLLIEHKESRIYLARIESSSQLKQLKFNQVLQQARNVPEKEILRNGSMGFSAVIGITKVEILQERDYDNCVEVLVDTDTSKLCFEQLSSNLVNTMMAKSSAQYSWVISVGLKNQYFVKQSNNFKAYGQFIFTLGDLLFDAILLDNGN